MVVFPQAYKLSPDEVLLSTIGQHLYPEAICQLPLVETL